MIHFIGSNIFALACLPVAKWDKVWWMPGGCDSAPKPEGATMVEEYSREMFTDVTALAAMRGAQSGLPAAEAFRLVYAR